MRLLRLLSVTREGGIRTVFLCRSVWAMLRTRIHMSRQEEKGLIEKGTSPKPNQQESARSPRLRPEDLEPLLEKLKMLEFGLYGLQQYRRSSGLDDEDIGPFYRLAEEISSDLLELQRRLRR